MLATHARRLLFSRDETIYDIGNRADYAYIVRSGVVRLWLPLAEGRSCTFRLLPRGALFGLHAIMDDSEQDHAATAHEDCSILAIPAHLVRNLARHRPEIAEQLAVSIARCNRQLRQRLGHARESRACVRLARVLLELAADHGVRDARGLLLAVRLTQSDLANLAGLSRESVNVTLRRLRTRGLVEWSGRSVRLLNRLGLELLGRPRASSTVVTLTAQPSRAHG